MRNFFPLTVYNLDIRITRDWADVRWGPLAEAATRGTPYNAETLVAAQRLDSVDFRVPDRLGGDILAVRID